MLVLTQKEWNMAIIDICIEMRVNADGNYYIFYSYVILFA